ncbi:hypothetical protein AMATHDRAFT_141299 [Amanita thiersii Skay4041]|uniref:Calcineurin-like phosphoesterase domain-containing protein n=1 Tax=Amanita thiersii Skay4041 TaxID=703135 RepID=A0A2A9NW41_9AGAR|nr:hypothetical protein AMATHDRAFT_141299 [Amanita thiersii Skay4041]
MPDFSCFRFCRALRSLCAPITAIICFSVLLTHIFILYQPTFGPGIVQRLGWQSWDIIIISDTPAVSDPHKDITNSTTDHSPGGHDNAVDWWNVTQPADVVDTTSLPLDVWAPLLPHDTGLSEITVTHCLADPELFGEVCAPPSTPEQDAIKGTWVRVPRNLNLEGGYMSGYLEIYYRRTRRQDINLVTDLKILHEEQEPSPRDDWHRIETSLHTGIFGAPPLFLWYKLGKTAAEFNTKEEKSNLITELDLLYGDDIPWYGFVRLEPPTLPTTSQIDSTWITYRRGVKIPPRAPPLHFSHTGQFKVLQIADLHYSVSQGVCRDTNREPCENSDNLTSTLLMHVLDQEKPDLVVFTGDQLNGQGTSWDPKSVLAKFARAATDRNIPWAAVFGNHDDENGASREEQLALMKALPYSLVERGPKDIHGVGNYVLKVLSADASKTHLLTLYFLDSGGYSRGYWNWWGIFQATAYDWIRQSQINWFLQESGKFAHSRPFHPDTGKDFGSIWGRQSDQVTPDMRKLAKPNALMFFHIPLPEAYNKADVDPRTRKPLDVGLHDLEGPGNAKTNEGFFEKGILQAMESDRRNAGPATEVKVVANGHCHITENCRRVQGVWMCFGGGGSYSGYGRIGFDRRFRVYEISDYGETIRTYKRTEKDEVIDEMILAGRGAAAL